MMEKINNSTIAVFVLLVLAVLSVNVYALSGSGTEADPYLIQSLSDFNDFVADASYWEDYTRLETDINLAGITYTNAPVSPDASSQFSGNFDGNGYGIVNLTVNTGHLLNHYLGLFGYIDSVGMVKNLTVADCNIIGRCDSDFIGALAGFNYGTIEECCVTGSLSGDDRLGGLVGYNSSGEINNCYAQVSIIGDDNKIGGLVGYSYNGNISYCYSTGAVSGSADVGGLIGGGNSDTITACFWDVQTSGQFTSAGGTGKTTSEMQEESTFTNAGWDFLGDAASGPDYVWTIDEGNDYPRYISLTGSGSESNPFLIRTLADFNEFSSNELYWASGYYTQLETDINLVSITYITAIIAPDTDDSTAGFQGTKFTGSFDGNGYKISNLTIDTIGNNNDYLGLFGYTDNGVVIKNLGVEDCNITDEATWFTWNIGVLVGRNEYGSISNCYATGRISANYGKCVGGLVGYDSYGNTNNCYAVVDISVNNGSQIGGLIGHNCFSSAVIDKCYALGNITGGNGSDTLGGLVGYCYNNVDISNSYATGIVIGDSNVGGLCGKIGFLSDISNCYSTGTVSGNINVGGLIGHDEISTSVNNCFWDTETSGQATSNGGTGKTTAEMKIASTFLNADWDFVEVWNIGERQQSYPLLRKYLSIDTNYDSKIDFADFAIFADYWLDGVE